MAAGNETIDVPYDEHGENGQFKQSYTPEMMVEAIEDKGGAASTSEVAESVGCSRRLALLRLRELEDDGRVAAREIGNTFLWSLETEDEDR